MRESLLDDALSPFISPLESGKPPLVKRRQFLQTLGIAGIGLAFASRGASAMTASAGVWRDCVRDFVYAVCDEDRAQVIRARLLRATLQYAPTPRDFHSNFSSPFIFVEGIDPESVICGNGFEVDQFPLYGSQVPCERCQDLNSSEIRRTTNQKERDFYGCVVSPVGQRQNRYDHARYLHTIEHYPYDPDDFNVGYARDFRAGKETVPGFYISHKTETGPNGKPLGDMLLG